MSVINEVSVVGKAAVVLSDLVMIALCASLAQAESEKKPVAMVKKEVSVNKKTPIVMTNKMQSKGFNVKLNVLQGSTISMQCKPPSCGNGGAAVK